MGISNDFGEFVRARRESLGKSLRGLAAEVGIAPAYLFDIEKGNRPAPGKHLTVLARGLELNGEEEARFYDLAGITRNSISPDLSDYVNKNELARVALRLARDRGISEEKWQKFIDEINMGRQENDD